MILQGKLTCRELSSLRVERGLIENIMTTAQVSEFKQKLLLYKFATKFSTWLGTDLSKEQAITNCHLRENDNIFIRRSKLTNGWKFCKLVEKFELNTYRSDSAKSRLKNLKRPTSRPNQVNTPLLTCAEVNMHSHNFHHSGKQVINRILFNGLRMGMAKLQMRNLTIFR